MYSINSPAIAPPPPPPPPPYPYPSPSDTELGALKGEYEEEVRTLESVITRQREELLVACERADAAEREVGVSIQIRPTPPTIAAQL